jgi:hypothetical protein
MQDWANRFKVVQQEGKQANNHYAGFGPATVNFFRQMIDLPSVNWHEDKVIHTDNASAIEPNQRSLSDYL